MFDFERLEVYQFALSFHKDLQNGLIYKKNLDRAHKDQLIRASLSIVLNLAEGSGRISHPDRRRFYIMSRGSVYECVALIEIIRLNGVISQGQHQIYYERIERISKMISGLIKSESNRK